MNRGNARARPGRVEHARFPPKKPKAPEVHRRAAGTPDSKPTAQQQRPKRAFSQIKTRPEEHQ
jgi:hypothetical protein